MQYNSHPVGHWETSGKIPLLKDVQGHWLSVIHKKNFNEIAFQNNVWYHLQAVDHRDDIAFYKIWNATHMLFVVEKGMWNCLAEKRKKPQSYILIGKKVMRLPWENCLMTLTPFWFPEKMLWDCILWGYLLILTCYLAPDKRWWAVFHYLVQYHCHSQTIG